MLNCALSHYPGFNENLMIKSTSIERMHHGLVNGDKAQLGNYYLN